MALSVAAMMRRGKRADALLHWGREQVALERLDASIEQHHVERLGRSLGQPEQHGWHRQQNRPNVGNESQQRCDQARRQG